MGFYVLNDAIVILRSHDVIKPFVISLVLNIIRLCKKLCKKAINIVCEAQFISTNEGHWVDLSDFCVNLGRLRKSYFKNLACLKFRLI